jgi:hypothetical protein
MEDRDSLLLLTEDTTTIKFCFGSSPMQSHVCWPLYVSCDAAEYSTAA